MNKFYFKCKACGAVIENFSKLFSGEQKCIGCSSDHVEVIYKNTKARLKRIFSTNGTKRDDMWRYLDVLPVNDSKNIVSFNEGNVAIERWKFLERFAKQHYGLQCRVYAHRHDNNPATGSFKDLAGSMAASVLKENSVNEYVLASTGNIGVSYARYLTNIGINLTVFIPQDASDFKEAEIACFGQKVFRVSGDYSYTKRLSSEFAKKFRIPVQGSSLDPIRIEAKKTIAFHFFSKMNESPTVYVQALSGGTGPLGVYKGCREMLDSGITKRLPRLFLVQSSRCKPMAEAFTIAKKKGFSDGWERVYPVYENPASCIPTLATGNPTAYPVLAKAVCETGGDIISVREDDIEIIARLAAFEVGARIGPASAVAVGGFFVGLNNNFFKDNDIVLINIGEGIRREPAFMLKMYNKSNQVISINECYRFNRDEIHDRIWSEILNLKNTLGE